MKSILDPSFKWTSSAATDVKATFARVRAEQAEAAKQKQANAAEAAQKVQSIPNRRTA